MSRAVKWLAIAFVVWWVVTSPASAGHVVQSLGHLATHAATSLSTALTSI